MPSSTILLVEDNPGDAVLLEKAFEMSGVAVDIGIEVSLTTDAALEVLGRKKNEIDLVIVDLKLAGMDGFGLLETLRSSFALHPVAVLTSSAREDDRERAEALGVPASSYFVKPMAIDGYQTIVKKLVGLMKNRAGTT